MDPQLTREQYAAIAVANDALSDAYEHACADAVAEVYLALRAVRRIVRVNMQPVETE